MTMTVSISDFRNNLSDYLDKALQGNVIIIKNKKRGRDMVEIKAKKAFDQKKYHDDYIKMLERVAGIFTTRNHPEWATKGKVIKWVEDGRKAAERNFDDLP